MIIVKSKNGVPVRLTRERWEHITRRHPEIREQKDKVLETLQNPDIILEGDFEELLSLKFYRQTSVNSKYMVVVYKEVGDNGFVITAYFTNKYSEKRRVLWKR